LKTFKEYITESLNKPYNIDYFSVDYSDDDRGIEGEFSTDTGTKYNIRGILKGRTKPQRDLWKRQRNDGVIQIPPLGIRKGGIWEVHFDRVKNGVYNNTITGDGDSLRVFASILEFTKELIKEQDPDIISIKSKTDQGDGSRTKLYNTIIKRYASKYGYKVKKVSVIKDVTRVELVTTKDKYK